jgi:hypothetical protein
MGQSPEAYRAELDAIALECSPDMAWPTGSGFDAIAQLPGLRHQLLILLIKILEAGQAALQLHQQVEGLDVAVKLVQHPGQIKAIHVGPLGIRHLVLEAVIQGLMGEKQRLLQLAGGQGG